jgi:tripartite-type tricarboxylate transporter receptor subunit TctC
MARLIGQHLSASIGQQIVIDNRPGASGILGSEVVSRAVPDGYALLIANVSLIVNPYLYPKMPYDPLKDFMPITMVNSAPLLLVVHPSIAAKSVTELIAYAKARPGQLNYGSGGLGSTLSCRWRLIHLRLLGADLSKSFKRSSASSFRARHGP